MTHRRLRGWMRNAPAVFYLQNVSQSESERCCWVLVGVGMFFGVMLSEKRSWFAVGLPGVDEFSCWAGVPFSGYLISIPGKNSIISIIYPWFMPEPRLAAIPYDSC